MQDLAWAWRIFGSFCQDYPIVGFAKNTLFLAKTPPPQGLELLMDDLESPGLKLVKNTPPL